MKTSSAGGGLVKEKLTPEISALPGKQRSPGFYNQVNSALSSATVYSLLVFMLLNIMLLIIDGPYHRTHTAQRTDDSLAKLRQIVFNSSYETNHSGPWPWWIAKAYLNGPAPDVAIMGDSQVNAAIFQADAVLLNKSVDCANDRDCPALKDKLDHQLKPTPNTLRLVNLAIGGAMPSDHYLIIKSLFTKKQHPKVVIITLSPRSFLDATLPCASATEIFQFFSPFVDLDKLVDYSFNNPAQKFFWLAQRKFALFACRQDIELSVHEFMENWFYKLYCRKSHNLPNDSSNRIPAAQSIYASNGLVPAGSVVVGPVPLTNFTDNRPEYSRRFAQMKPETLTAQSAFLSVTLAYLKEIGVPVIVVDMPMLQPVRALLPVVFWDTYRFGLKNSCIANNAHWLDLDATDEFPQSEFLDYVHLNAAGGNHLMDRIASFIQNDNDLHSHLQ